MNFLAHSRNHLGRPYAVIGTAVPDLIAMGDRRVKLRRPHVPETPSGDVVSDELRLGVLAHFEDDRWFHQSQVFDDVTGEITRRLRDAAPAETKLRASVLGHIGMEMLLDAELAKRDPTMIDRYYRALHAVNPGLVTAAINRWAPKPTLRLSGVIRFFRAAAFLHSYQTDDGLWLRLSQVTRRLKLGSLPDSGIELLPGLRALVAEHADELLTPPD